MPDEWSGWLIVSVWVAGALLLVGGAPFYTWIQHPRIRRRGTRATGVVLNVRSEERFFGHESETVATYHWLTYEFLDASGRTWTNITDVGSRGRDIPEGTQITVYYLPENPDKSLVACLKAPED